VTEGSTLTWWSASAFSEQAAAGQILQASLAQIGINLDIQTNDVATWVSKFYPAGLSYPGYIIANYQSVPASPAFSMNFLLSGRCECNWNSTAYDDAFASAIATTDATAQQGYWDAAQKLENEEVPLITPIISAPVTATSSSVSGVWLEGGGQVHLEDASID
jgi:peptide/nickel transport system substrate-binding protein